jgi:hypothetical protein
MFGSTIIDVAIGLVFVYLLLSLVVTAGTEFVASGLGWRAKNLRAGLERLLGPALARELYAHPMINRLSKSGQTPSYIPSETFALTLVDVIANLGPAPADAPRDLASLIANVPDPDVRRVLGLLAAEAGPDGQKVKENIEKWFNSSMDRVAGWYKRRTQAVNIGLAIVFTVAVNADSLLIVNRLSNDAALRAALVAQAQVMVRDNPSPATSGQPNSGPNVEELQQWIDRLTGLGLPVGWTAEPSTGFRQWPGWLPGGRAASAWGAAWAATVRYHFLGWVLTALAASLGAPLWFDLLSKIVTIRSSGKVPARSAAPAGT